MEFNELIQEFGLTIEAYENPMSGSVCFCFRSKDGQYRHKRNVSVEEIRKIGEKDLEKIITEEVQYVFRKRGYDLKVNIAEKLLDKAMNTIRSYIPQNKEGLVRDAFLIQDPNDIYTLMGKRDGRIQAMMAFHQYLEELKHI
jgi:hypothetical protein